MKIQIYGLLLHALFAAQPLFGEAAQGKAPQKSADHEPDGHDEHDHGKKDSHDHEEKGKDEHGHGHDEVRGNVGPNKGVLQADAEQGFVLSDKAEKNFAIRKQMIQGKGPYTVPASALLYSAMEKQVYRYRNRHWKAVSIKIIKKSPQGVIITSQDLAPGDSIASVGVGFLKIVDQSVFGPEIEGHVH